MKKGKFSTQIVTKDLWKQFQNSSIEYKNITWEEFYSSWLEMAETIRNEAISNPLGTKLPSYTGELKLQYVPNSKFEAVDRTVSEELGKKVGHLNLVTRGKVAILKWERRQAVKFNKMLQYYAFRATRIMHKMAKEYIDKNSESLRVSRNTLGGKTGWNIYYPYKFDKNAKRNTK